MKINAMNLDNRPLIKKVVPEGDVVKVHFNTGKVITYSREAWENHITFLNTKIYKH